MNECKSSPSRDEQGKSEKHSFLLLQPAQQTSTYKTKATGRGEDDRKSEKRSAFVPSVMEWLSRIFYVALWCFPSFPLVLFSFPSSSLSPPAQYGTWWESQQEVGAVLVGGNGSASVLSGGTDSRIFQAWSCSPLFPPILFSSFLPLLPLLGQDDLPCEGLYNKQKLFLQEVMEAPSVLSGRPIFLLVWGWWGSLGRLRERRGQGRGKRREYRRRGGCSNIRRKKRWRWWWGRRRRRRWRWRRGWRPGRRERCRRRQFQRLKGQEKQQRKNKKKAGRTEQTEKEMRKGKKRMD